MSKAKDSPLIERMAEEYANNIHSGHTEVCTNRDIQFIYLAGAKAMIEKCKEIVKERNIYGSGTTKGKCNEILRAFSKLDSKE